MRRFPSSSGSPSFFFSWPAALQLSPKRKSRSAQHRCLSPAARLPARLLPLTRPASGAGDLPATRPASSGQVVLRLYAPRWGRPSAASSWIRLPSPCPASRNPVGTALTSGPARGRTCRIMLFPSRWLAMARLELGTRPGNTYWKARPTWGTGLRITPTGIQAIYRARWLALGLLEEG